MTISERVQTAIDGMLQTRCADEKSLRYTIPEHVLRGHITAALSTNIKSIHTEVKRWHDALSPGAEPERMQLQHVMRLLEEKLRA